MFEIKIATKTRGFLNELFEYDFDNIKFIKTKEESYEIPSKTRVVMSKIIRMRVLDILGIFQVVKTGIIKEDMAISYNRFLETNKPYIIILENPLALVNYSMNRTKYVATKKRVKKYLEDDKLKAIICMSQACYITLEKYYELPQRLEVAKIYPLIKDESKIRVVDKLECLYISSDFSLKGGDDILRAIERLKDENIKIHCTIITKSDSLDKEQMYRIRKLQEVTLVEFNMKKDELNKYYKKSSILLNPTRLDSFSLVTLEAIKHGLIVIASDMYAIKEMVKDGKNGFLIKPKYSIWNENNMPNKKIYYNRKKTIKSKYVDYNMVDFLYKKLRMLSEDREKLKRMQEMSYQISLESFSEKEIVNEWKNIILEEKSDWNNYS